MAVSDAPTVVVTGGAGGIGEATVRLFAEKGARVVFGDIREEKGRAVADALGSTVVFKRTDVRHEDQVEELLDLALAKFGRLDCMVNNASTGGVHGPIGDTPAEGFKQTIDLTLGSVFLGIKHAARRMDRRRGGTIINIASIAGLQAGYGSHSYSTAKAAIIGLTRTTAMELGEVNIRVNCICPAGIVTGIFGTSVGLSPEMAEKTREAVVPWIAAGSPLKRACRPEEVAHTIYWLSSAEASFINGIALVMDGGITGGRLWSQSQAEGGMLVELLYKAAAE